MLNGLSSNLYNSHLNTRMHESSRALLELIFAFSIQNHSLVLFFFLAHKMRTSSTRFLDSKFKAS